MDKDKIHPIDGRIYNPLQKSPGKKYGAVNRLVPKRSRMMKKSASDGRFLNPAGKIELAGSKSVVALEEKKDVVEVIGYIVCILKFSRRRLKRL